MATLPASAELSPASLPRSSSTLRSSAAAETFSESRPGLLGESRSEFGDLRLRPGALQRQRADVLQHRAGEGERIDEQRLVAERGQLGLHFDDIVARLLQFALGASRPCRPERGLLRLLAISLARSSMAAAMASRRLRIEGGDVELGHAADAVLGHVDVSARVVEQRPRTCRAPRSGETATACRPRLRRRRRADRLSRRAFPAPRAT